jgi:branched-chain amino acid transport system permease protein
VTTGLSLNQRSQGLSALRVSKSFDGLHALREASVSLLQGEVLGILGPNGSGKTTLLNILSGTLTPSSGQIVIDGQDASRWSPRLYVRAGVARTFQNIRLFKHLTVFENVLVAAASHPDVETKTKPPEAIAERVLNELGLEGSVHLQSHWLSYGDQRRLEIARALALGPKYLLLDEPAAGMNEAETLEVGRLVKGACDVHGLGILLIEHDVGLLMDVSDRVVALNGGVVIARGSPAAIRSNPHVIEAYMGGPT